MYVFHCSIDKTGPAFSGHDNLTATLEQFQNRVFLTPHMPFAGSVPFTEINWWQLVTTSWESHKNNYFLRKFESEVASRVVHQ